MQIIAQYLYRLLPGNPILLRVVEGGGKRRRDLFIRCGYLGLLVFLVVFALLSGAGSSGNSNSLSDLAQTSAALFQRLSYLQLALVALLSPIFTAGAITQEKDSQTYDILLATPLSNAQIVLGSLMSRLFFVIALLVSGIPIFSITQMFGGVAIRSIGISFLIAAATACVTGAAAMAIATFKVGTRRTIFSFYLVIVMYLVGLYLLDQLEYFHPLFDPARPTNKGVSWFTGIHPFLALRAIFNDQTYLPAQSGALPEALKAWPLNWYFTSPQTFYVAFMFVLSFLLVMPSILMLRRMAQASTSFKTWVLQKLKITSGDRTKKPRLVWSNPIAWREARTKASAARAYVLRYGFMALGLGGAMVLVCLFATELTPAEYITPSSYDPQQMTLTLYAQSHTPVPRRVDASTAVTIGDTERPHVELSALHARYEVLSTTFTNDGKTLAQVVLGPVQRRLPAEDARRWLLGAVILEFAVILLIVTNAAASTVTREKEDGTLDLLLTTPITSRYYIWGKLRGLVSFVLPLVAVPVASILLFVVYDLFRLWRRPGVGNFEWVVFPEAVLVLPGTLVIVAAFASILGMQMSLRLRTTVTAVMGSIGIVVGACFGLGFCGYNVMNSRTSEFGLVVGSFSPFTLVMAMIDPWKYAESAFSAAHSDDVGGYRFILFLFGWAAIAAYTALVWQMYRGMVKNFDMTIRRQSR